MGKIDLTKLDSYDIIIDEAVLGQRYRKLVAKLTV
jgi:hypothetical protein